MKEEQQLISHMQALALMYEDRPWEEEPDEKSYNLTIVRGEPIVFNCEILRHPTLLHLCGYVSIDIPKEVTNQIRMRVERLDVHGGVTYFEHKKDRMTVGFDCSHSVDFSPGLYRAGLNVRVVGHPCNYKTIAYVEKQIKRLAGNLADLLIRAGTKNGKVQDKQDQRVLR